MIRLWFILALATAFFASLKDIFSKHAVNHSNPYLVAWTWTLGSLPFLLPLAPLLPLARPAPAFWPALLAGSLLHVAATVLYLRAIEASDLSLTIPIIALSPLFLLVTSPLMLGERPSAAAGLGILLIVAGSYVLNINEYRKGWQAPFRALLREPGPRLMLGVVAIWSVTANIDKIGIRSASPLTWLLAVNSLVAVLLLPLVRRHTPRLAAVCRRESQRLLPVAICSALMLVMQMYAIKFTLVPQVIAIKRTSVLFSVFLGGWLFREKHLRQRGLGAAIMVAGTMVILLAAGL
ncbi:MAG: EamA family transporter [Deltaproteobacteria bacterium]|nr:EamA family transporter [Deltaproteobacteria bacterium]